MMGRTRRRSSAGCAGRRPRLYRGVAGALLERAMADSRLRDALFREAKLLGVAYMPYKVAAHRIATDLMHPTLTGYKRHPFMRDWWRYVDIEQPAPQ